MNDLTQNDLCVPGEWKCEHCGFIVIKSIIDTAGGEGRRRFHRS